MDIIDADFLTIGLKREDGSEPDELDEYKRQPIRLRWDPASDAEDYVNVDRIDFPQATWHWGTLVSMTIFAGNADVVNIPLTVTQTVGCGMHVSIVHRAIRISREILVNKYGDVRRSFASYTDHNPRHPTFELMPEHLSCVKYDLEWPRRYIWRHGKFGELRSVGYHQSPGDFWRYADSSALTKRLRVLEEENRALQEENRMRRQLLEDARALEKARGRNEKPTLTPEEMKAAFERFPAMAPWHRPAEYPPKGPLDNAVANSMAMARSLEALERGEGKPLLGVDKDPPVPWATGTLPGKLMRDTSGLERRISKVDKLNGKPLGKPPEERKIVVPAPRFWGQLDQALNAPKKAAPPKEMPTVEPTPAGAEELIGWARAHEDKAAWAEKLSIPRVTRMLKEMTSYGKRWAESDLVALASY